MAGFGVFLEEDCNESSRVDRVDVYVGDGVTVKFFLQEKTVAELTSSIQTTDTTYVQALGGFSKDGADDSFTVNSAPANDSSIVAPGVIAVVAPLFDQATVPGLTNPLEVEVPLWVGDPDTIATYRYVNMPEDLGMNISVTDLIPGVGASTSWCYFASADTDGTALTYGASATDLEIAGLLAFSTISASAIAGAGSINVSSVSGFLAGDYIIIAPGTGNVEKRRITSVGISSLTLSTVLDHAHSPGEFIFTAYRKIWMKVVVPENVTNNEGASLYDIGLDVRARKVIR
jgi:hypothetical protein